MNPLVTAFCTGCGKLISGVGVDVALVWVRGHHFAALCSDRDYRDMLQKVLAQAAASLQTT